MKKINLLQFITLSVFLFSCASPAKMENMLVSKDQIGGVKFDQKLKKEINVDEVKGGDKTNPLWTSEIGNKEFKEALISTLDNAGLLADSINSGYELSANLLSVEQPFAGFDLEVTTVVEYSLIERKSGKEIMKEVLVASHTAGVGDSVLAVKRLRLANEGSAQKNIFMLIDVLSKLNIDKEQISVTD